jgi:hypothetical protein
MPLGWINGDFCGYLDRKCLIAQCWNPVFKLETQCVCNSISPIAEMTRCESPNNLLVNSLAEHTNQLFLQGCDNVTMISWTETMLKDRKQMLD